MLVGTLAYVLIFPPDPLAARRYVTYRIRRGLGLLARMPADPALFAIGRRACTTASTGCTIRTILPARTTDEWFEAGLGALTLGNEILRLRHWLEREPLPRARRAGRCGQVVDALRRFLRRARAAPTTQVKRGCAQLAPLDPGPGPARSVAPGRASSARWRKWMSISSHIPRLLNRAPVP